MGKFGVPTDEQLAKINKLAKRTLSSDEVFVFPSKLAGDMIIPDRYVQLQKELLDIYAADAKNGVSLLLDHSWSPDGFWGLGGRPKAAIPYGRTFDSRFEASTEEGETISLMADHYMVKGVEIDGIKTNDLAASIEAGTLFDTSIGFGFNKSLCSICGNNYRDYDKCKHIAGKTYEVEDADGVTRNQLCYQKAYPPGFLMENSLVFDGAYPGAGVLSSVGGVVENANGIFEVVDDIKSISPDVPMLAVYSARFGLTAMVKKSDHKKVYPMKGGEKQMDEKVKNMLEAFGIADGTEGKIALDGDALKAIAEKWDAAVQTVKDSAAPLKPLEAAPGITDEFITQEQANTTLGKEYAAAEILKFAKEGITYHAEVVDEAIAWGVRAQGNDFPAETWKATFSGMGTKQIKDIMKTFEAQAKADIPAGRATDPEADNGAQAEANIPDEAYRA